MALAFSPDFCCNTIWETQPSFCFFTLVISSCGVVQNELRKQSLCQGYDELSNCTNETSFEQMTICTESALQNTRQKLNGKKVEVSYTQDEYRKIQTRLVYKQKIWKEELMKNLIIPLFFYY